MRLAMSFIRLVGLGLCPTLLCGLATLGVYRHVRYLSGPSLAISGKALMIVSVLGR
jgi:hypothetical protein